MTEKKRHKPPARRNGADPEERVSLAPLDPVEALKGLLATPTDARPKRRKSAKKK
jgi:hypothetical protein